MCIDVSCARITTDALDDKFADPKYKIKQELRKIKDSFIYLLSDIHDSLSRKVSTERIVTFVVMYAQEPQQLAIAERDLKHIDNATSTHEVFRILSKYWSFLEHDMLVSIVRHFGGRKIRRKVKEYRKQLKKFFEERRMSEIVMPLRCIDNTYVIEFTETHDRVIVKLDLNDPTWHDIIHQKEKICAILEILPSTLLICKVEDGCIEVTFYIPRLVAKEIFKESLKVEQCEALTSISVVTISVNQMCENVIFNVSCTPMYWI